MPLLTNFDVHNAHRRNSVRNDHNDHTLFEMLMILDGQQIANVRCGLSRARLRSRVDARVVNGASRLVIFELK
jgi:hypothetical protein